MEDIKKIVRAFRNGKINKDMTRLEKIKIAIEKGITCDIYTGKVYGVRGKEIISKKNGYTILNIKGYNLYTHQFIFYKAYGKIVEQIDHINGNRADNRIENLRECTNQKNHFNLVKTKGYSWNKLAKKWQAQICFNAKRIYLGLFDKEEDARNAYLEAKKIYHII